MALVLKWRALAQIWGHMPDTSHQERTFLFSALVYILKYISGQAKRNVLLRHQEWIFSILTLPGLSICQTTKNRLLIPQVFFFVFINRQLFFASWLPFYHKLFFYKNKVYKNTKHQICWKLKNILDAEIVIILQLFLNPHIEAQNTFYARKVNFFGVFWRNMETKI